MNAIKTYYEDIPESIKVPADFAHRKGEIIIILDEDIPSSKNKKLKDFFGAIPDFPERADQGNYEERDEL